MNFDPHNNPFSSSIQTEIRPPGFTMADSVEDDSAEHTNAECQLKRRLKYFFMNPCEKYKAKKKFPWKLGLQLIKIILVTTQLAMFGIARSSHVEFIEKSSKAFKHLYLKDWNPSYETLPYPPATGIYAVYTIPTFFESVNYALRRYNVTESLAVGTYNFDNLENERPPMQMCHTFYKVGFIFAFNRSFVFDNKHITDCFDLHPVYVHNAKTNTTSQVYDTQKFLEQQQKEINFDSLIRIDLNFNLTTIHLRSLSGIDTPDCFLFKIQISFHNEKHNGQMVVDLKSEEVALKCREYKILSADRIDEFAAGATLVDGLVIVSSFLSLILCIRSLIRGEKLRQMTVKFFKEEKRRDLDWEVQSEFLNFWHILIVINDILVIIGSVLKIQIEYKASHQYEVCGVLLGTANLLVWFGVLRYLGFFEKYNILILTMKKSAPNILRFLVCAGLFYFGFAVCGWVVLGPYHIKFRTLGSTSECLFSLVNGDDMYVTFAVISNSNSYVYYYSRIYLYAFISFFIYVVLNVFISVIMDTYEVIKKYYEEGFPTTELHDFIAECTEDPSDMFDSNRSHFSSLCLCSWVPNFLQWCCDRCQTRETFPEIGRPTESSPLIS